MNLVTFSTTLKIRVHLTFLVLLLFIPLTSSAIEFKAIREIHVDFYPGTAKVIVKGVPGATTTTPGILKLSSSYPDLKAVNFIYEIRFVQEDYESEPIFLEPTNFKLSFKACCLSLSGLILCSAYLGHPYELKPTNIFAINKKKAISLGKIEPLISALKSEIIWVRADAAEALGEIGNKRAIDPLIMAMKGKESTRSLISYRKKTSCIGCIPGFGFISKLASDLALAGVRNIKNYEDDLDVNTAIKALSKIGKSAIEPLISSLTDNSIKEKAALALAEFGHSAIKAVPNLIESFPIYKKEVTLFERYGPILSPIAGIGEY